MGRCFLTTSVGDNRSHRWPAVVLHAVDWITLKWLEAVHPIDPKSFTTKFSSVPWREKERKELKGITPIENNKYITFWTRQERNGLNGGPSLRPTLFWTLLLYFSDPFFSLLGDRTLFPFPVSHLQLYSFIASLVQFYNQFKFLFFVILFLSCLDNILFLYLAEGFL